uniref:NADH-ubiquinone oxidoreductase chain 1 n=1 Tax=Nylanderia flavipes TaxID=67766 RepID=A0A6B9BQH3_9HYME|nr:NADH dehydrogenase subunit 1 [Nylanderia flavipes]QGW36355.1 NADH dehydrogenase subunit 1 [Nylanderia flavipes]
MNSNFYIYMGLNLVSLVIMLLIVLIGVAFLTLLERKILSYIQIRKGPNKVGIIGLFQPFSDAIKLLNKELFYVYKSNYNFFYMCPVISFMMMMMMWLVFPFITNIYFLNYSVLLMIIFMTIGGYVVIFMGWSANSVYSMMGSMRSVSQMLSYEVSFILIILIIMLMSESYSIIDFMNYQLYLWYLVVLYPLFLLFFISILAELNRSPMDFIEGESELVSGFNIEYFSGGFTLIFLSEYGMIIFFSLISIYMFSNLLEYSLILIFFMINFLCGMVIFMRGMLPRMRYDELMYLCWKIILPVILVYIMLVFGFKFLLLMVL